MLAACSSTLALAGCLSGESQATRISRVFISNWLEESRRVVLELTRDGRTVVNEEFRVPPSSDGVLGSRKIEMDWPDDPAVYVLKAQYPAETDYDGATSGRSEFTLDPVPGGENDCTYVRVKIGPTGGLTYTFGNKWCAGTTS